MHVVRGNKSSNDETRVFYFINTFCSLPSYSITHNFHQPPQPTHLECVSSFHERLSQLYACSLCVPWKKKSFMLCVSSSLWWHIKLKIIRFWRRQRQKELSLHVHSSNSYFFFLSSHAASTPLRDVKSSLIQIVTLDKKKGTNILT